MFKILTLTWLYLLGTCLAQNSSLPEDCSPSDFTDNVDKRAIFFNASGTLPIEFKGAKDPCRYLVADKSVGVCSYMFQGLNSSSENPGDADESCKGVIRDACIEEFENSTLPIRTSGGCPSSAAFILSAQCKKHLTLYQLVLPRNISTDSCIDEFENSRYAVDGTIKKCRSLVSLNLSDECRNYIWTTQTTPRNFSSAAVRWSVDKMPYIDLPKDYITFGTGLWTGLIGDEDRKDYDMYDLRVQQTIPLLFAASGMSRLICIAPDQIVPGSRKPQLKLEEDEPEEDENTASRAGGLGAAIFLGVGAMIFSLL
ncbi:hypothetical protein FAGAP_3725 [Fusarium agapanthi]|uniref:Uncharacterized protein n=1 Tax=Fusarium agapanthi TaxID=1803897 RepID=A0A9P5EGG1_9HYPO|nr:hypothetical protein FAGAP_3725 [Fusarium agapanthi]